MTPKVTFMMTAECSICNATGLRALIFDSQESYLVCPGCFGSGKVDINISYTPFVKRKEIDNVTKVIYVDYSDERPMQPLIYKEATYQQFKAGDLPGFYPKEKEKQQ